MKRIDEEEFGGGGDRVQCRMWDRYDCEYAAGIGSKSTSAKLDGSWIDRKLFPACAPDLLIALTLYYNDSVLARRI